MAEIKIGNKAKLYIGDKEICEIKEITLPPAGEPIFAGMDLSAEDDLTAIHLTGTFHEAFVHADLLNILVNDLTKKVQEIAGVTEQEARQYVLNRLGLDDFDLAFGRGVPLTRGLLTGNELKAVIVDEFGVPPKMESAELSTPIRNVRSTKDATPWTHKRQPWQAHRPKKGKR